MDKFEVDLLDLLAYNSDELIKICGTIDDENEQDNTIKTYLEKHCQTNFGTIEDFEKDLDWFNVTEPIRLEQLLGKLVLLDFFTYCCINCVHILPDLKAIECLHPVESGIVVIGIHSAKFENEKDSANLLSAIQRYNISHPVVNDCNLTMWSQLKIKCWPTLLFLSPTGSPLLVIMGEGHGLFLKSFVKSAITFFKKRGELSEYHLPLNPSNNLLSASNLRFPSKICCRFHNGKQCDLIAISDSGNHRVLILNVQGFVLEKIGGFDSGFVNGDFQTAKFNFPQGLTFLNDDVLIVADTNNHAIRKVSLTERLVTCLAGTGKQGFDKIGGQLGTNQELSSPWDVAVFKTRDMDMSFHVDERNVPEKIVILIAMAGTHQVWGIFLNGIIWWKFKKYEPLTCVALIGNGSEENRNNSYPQNAAFAQPSGLSVIKDILLIADSESSSIRRASMIDGKVTGVVGGDRNPLNLFSYGDIDGKQFSAKLQHPLSVFYNTLDEYLYVSDTFNHKIKRVNVKNNVIETCLIRKKDQSEIFQFSEPDGICSDSSGKCLYIADTNNHSIQMVDLGTMCTWPLILKFHLPLYSEIKSNLTTYLEKDIKINRQCKLNLNTTLLCENNLKLTDNASQKWRLNLPNGGCSAERISGEIIDGKFSTSVNVDNAFEDIQLICHVNICCGNTCMRKDFCINIKLIYEPGSHKNIIEDQTVYLEVDAVSLFK